MKKFLATLLALTMVLTLVGCSSGEATPSGEAAQSGAKSESAKTELVWWAHSDAATWLSSYQAIIDAFEDENPDITIRLETFPYDEFESKVLTSLTSKKGGADIYELWGGWGVDYASTGAFAAMPDDLANEIMNDAYPSTYGALEYEGKLYGMPMEFNIEYGAMIANLDLLKEAGLEVATTWDELIDQAKQLTVEENGVLTKKGLDFCNSDGMTYIFTAMMLQNGVQYQNPDGSFNFNNDVAKKAFKEIADLLVGDGRVTELGELVDASVYGYDELYNGITAYVPRGPWALTDGRDIYGLTLGKEIDYVPLPAYGDNNAFAAETGWSLAINGKSENQDAAFRFLEFFFKDDNISNHNVQCAQIPAKKSVAQSAEYLEACPYAKPLIDILDEAQFVGYFNTDKLKENITTTFIDYVQGGVYNSIDEAVADLEDKCNNTLR